MKKDKKHGNLDSDGYERGYGLLRYLTMTALQSKHFALKNRFPALADRFLCVRGFPPLSLPPPLSHMHLHLLRSSLLAIATRPNNLQALNRDPDISGKFKHMNYAGLCICLSFFGWGGVSQP